MKYWKFLFAICVLIPAGCNNQSDFVTAPYAASSQPLSLQGQKVISHELVETWGGRRPFRVYELSFTKRPPFPMQVAMPFADGAPECLPAETAIAWPGDDEGHKILQNNAGIVWRRVWDRFRDPNMVAFSRPFSYQSASIRNGYYTTGWRSLDEMRSHIAAIDYLVAKFCLKKFTAIGHSGGGTVAISIAQQHPNLISEIYISASSLSYRIKNNGNRPDFAYDPIDRLHLFDRNTPIFLTSDPISDSAVDRSMNHFIKKAEEQGVIISKFEIPSKHAALFAELGQIYQNRKSRR